MILTDTLIRAGMSPNGGWKLSQLRALRTPLPDVGWPKSGWKARLIGTEVSESEYATFLALGQQTRQEDRAVRLHDRMERKFGGTPDLFKP